MPHWRPLFSRVQNAQDAHQISGCVVDQDVILMRHQLACISDSARPTKTGKINQTVSFRRKKLIKGQCCAWVIGLNVVIDCTAVDYGFWRPEQFHDPA